MIADDSADPRILAADLLAQAEHDVHTCVGMATTSPQIARATLAEIERQLTHLPTAATAGEALKRQGEIVICRDEEQLIAWADHMATEHLQVHTRDPHATASKIRNYGSLFIGQNASVVFSDKCCGTNHTLPTMALRLWLSPRAPESHRRNAGASPCSGNSFVTRQY